MTDTKSDSSQSSTQASYDQRNAADNGAIVVGQGSNYTINFPEQAVSIISKVLDFSSGVVSKAGTIAEDSVMSAANSNQALISSNNQIKSQDQLGGAALINNIIPVLMIGAVGLVIFVTFRKH